MLHRGQGEEDLHRDLAAPGLDSGVGRKNWDKIPITPGKDFVVPMGTERTPSRMQTGTLWGGPEAHSMSGT